MATNSDNRGLPKEETVFAVVNVSGRPLAETTIAYEAGISAAFYRRLYGGEIPDSQLRIVEYRMIPVRTMEMPPLAGAAEAVAHD